MIDLNKINFYGGITVVLGYEKLSLINQPTPLEYLANISKELGIEFFIKRDDLTNIGLGGNKLRKLEYILKDALDKGATMLITQGGVQTNHGRLTAAAAAKYRLKCAIASIGEYPGELSGNLLLHRIFGADVVIKKSDGRPEIEQYNELIESLIEKYESKGEKVYYIPLGGSDEMGVLGYYDCALELIDQTSKMGIDNARLIAAVGSIGTYMGLYCGLKNQDSSLECTGIAIMPFNEHKEKYMVGLFKKVKEKFNLDISAQLSDFDIEKGYVRGGYNHPSKEVRDAIYLMARNEGIILDPCYTGKCFAAIIDMINEGKIKKGETIILIHTGGSPGIYTKHHRIEMENELLDGVYLV